MEEAKATHGTASSDTTDHLTLTNTMSWHYCLCPFFWGFYEHTSDFRMLTFWAGGLARGCALLSNTEQPSAQPALDLAVSSPEDSLFPSCWLAALWRQIGFSVNSPPPKVTKRAGMANRASMADPKTQPITSLQNAVSFSCISLPSVCPIQRQSLS